MSGGMFWRIALVLWWCAVATCAHAAQGFLSLPLQCPESTGCVVQQYFDHDQGTGYQDYMCGRLSYDGHQGTDFRLRDLVQMELGVVVRAAAPGTVIAVRDGMDDVNVRQTGAASLKGRLAGNAVVLRHENGFETQYSHLAKGSVAVRVGQSVAVGEKLGLVGLSGNTEFPHLEFAVRRQGHPVDPFAGLGPCAKGTPLWRSEALEKIAKYRVPRLLHAGFADAAPTLDTVEARRHVGTRFTVRSPALVFWVVLMGVGPDDVVRCEILNPHGQVVARHESEQERHLVNLLRYVGRRRATAPWPTGCYLGRVEVVRRTETGGMRVVLKREVLVDVYDE